MEQSKPVENTSVSEEDKKVLEELARKVSPSDYIAAYNTAFDRPRFAGMIRQQVAELVKSEDETKQ